MPRFHYENQPDDYEAGSPDGLTLQIVDNDGNAAILITDTPKGTARRSHGVIISAQQLPAVMAALENARHSLQNKC
jgi:hypothetical protein